MQTPEEQKSRTEEELSREVSELKESLASVRLELSDISKQIGKQPLAPSPKRESGSSASHADFAGNQRLANRGMQIAVIAAAVNLISIATIAFTCCNAMSKGLSAQWMMKTRIMTVNLSAVLGDPFSMGEYEHMQQIIDSAKKTDADLQYVIVESADGRAVATTKPELKNMRLSNNDLEQSALRATDFSWRAQPNGTDFEAVMPIRTAGGQAGILRVGTSHERIDRAINDIVSIIMAIAFISTLILFTVILRFDFSAASSPASHRR